MAVLPVLRLIDSALTAAGVPFVGLGIGSDTDRATWRVDFDPSATPAQKATAANILQTVAIDAAAVTAQAQKDAQITVDSFDRPIKGLILALIDQLNVIRAALPSPLAAITPQQALAAIRAKAGQL